MKQVKAITDIAQTTNITETRHMIGLIGYYRKFFPIFSDMKQPSKQTDQKIYLSNGLSNVII